MSVHRIHVKTKENARTALINTHAIALELAMQVREQNVVCLMVSSFTVSPYSSIEDYLPTQYCVGTKYKEIEIS